MEQNSPKDTMGHGLVAQHVFFLIYLLCALVDGGLCIALGQATISRTASILCCILLSGVPLFCAGWCSRLNRPRVAIVFTLIHALFAVACGCMMRVGHLLYSLVSVKLLLHFMLAVLAVTALTLKNRGQSAKGMERFLLLAGIVSAAVSLVFSLYEFNVFRGMRFVGLQFWMAAFRMGNPFTGMAMRQGSQGLLTGSSGSCLALNPLSDAFCILMMWNAVRMALIHERQDLERFPDLRKYRERNPGINRVTVSHGSFEYLKAYSRNH